MPTVPSVSQSLLSVIVPAKDAAGFLGDCLTSLTRQFRDPGRLEVVVVDDGSVDATTELAESFTDRLRIVCVRNPHPTGLASARNAGLRASSGELIAYLDADDWLVPGHLEHLAERMAALDVDFIRTDHCQVREGQRTWHRAPWGRRDEAFDPRAGILPAGAPTMVDYCYAWAGVFHRRIEHLLAFPEGLHTAEDRSWAWRLHLQASSFAVVDGPGVMYRRNVDNSLTQIVDRRQLDFLAAFGQIFDLVQADPEADRWWPKAARMTLAIVAHHINRRSLMDRPTRHALIIGSKQLISQIPSRVLDEVWAVQSEERQAILAPLRDGTSVLLNLPSPGPDSRAGRARMGRRGRAGAAL